MTPRLHPALWLTLASLPIAACAASAEPILVAPTPAASATAAQAEAIDPLGPRPEPAEPAPFLPPSPEVFDGPGGSKVWLFERHNLPLVSVALVVPVGGAAEPADLDGLAFVTADMLDEGGGSLDALAFSSKLEELGARLTSGADRDRSYVSLETLSGKLPESLALLSDAVLKPRHASADWKRVSSLWKNAVKARGDDPNDVARVVTSAAFFGNTHPYGRPLEGTVASTAKVKLQDVSRWHKAIWRPDIATFVVVGDTTKSAVTEQLSKQFAGWKAPQGPSPATTIPVPSKTHPRTVLVDRPSAPQVVLSIMRDGVPANDPALPRLTMLNVALGGSFTSRLNQSLREEHGWTYGARSRFVGQKYAGVFLARAAIHTEVISDALPEMLHQIDGLARGGLSDEELSKVRALVRADAIDTYGQLSSVASTLAFDAALGLPPDAEARSLASQSSATREALSRLAGDHLPSSDATIVLVGPRQPIEEALSKSGLPAPELRDVEGAVIDAKPASKR